MIETIQTVGFPIAVVVYLLYERRENTDKVLNVIKENTASINDLRMMIRERFKK